MNVETYFLYPATLFASNQPHQVNTILGSCVAVCLFDSVLKIGGINHYMLPLWNGQGLASPRYGNIAIEKLLGKMVDLGSNKRHLQAKVFGGGEILDNQSGNFNIGDRNIEIANQMLDDYNIPIVSSSVGGKLGRKIIFFTHTGEVMQRYVGTNKP